MKVLLLAGGYGTRLSEETDIKPKPMIEINGVPMLLHIINHYNHYGFKKFTVLGGFKIDYIHDYFGTLFSRVEANTYKYNDLHDAFTKLDCKLDYVYGQASQLVTQEVLEYMTYVGNLDETYIHSLPGAMHHLFLDMPEEFMFLIKRLLSK